jgi:glutamate-1-semialdehyde 2,1-aminomutase
VARSHTQLKAFLWEAYEKHAPKSAALNQRAVGLLIDGGSHALRLIEPFPPRVEKASGAYVWDLDGNRLLDFWQGHYANILGHGSRILAGPVADAFRDGRALLTGFTSSLQVEAAQSLCDRTGAERVRFTTSGSLATMYAVMLSRAFTGRDLILKIGGGWHGSQPWGLKGVGFREDAAGSSWVAESEGIPDSVTDEVLITRFNDADMLRDQFERYGDRLACFLTEPVVGAGGFIPASPEYLRTARELTHRYGTVLVFDEVIAGFRFRAGNVGALYQVQPDLATFGKIIGGGMPVAAVAGRADIMELVGRDQGKRVKFSGGTYSGHPACMLATKTVIGYLTAHEEEIYPGIATLGEKARRTMEQAFASEGILARCTGYGNEALTGSSLGMCHFPYDQAQELTSPDDVYDPVKCDVELRDQLLQLALIIGNVHVMHGLGAVSTAHTEADIARLGEECSRAAHLLKKYL